MDEMQHVRGVARWWLQRGEGRVSGEVKVRKYCGVS